MKVSLNDLASILTSRVGQPLNADLLEEVKVILNYKRAEFFKRLLEQHPDQRQYFYKDFTAELQTASKGECPITTECEIYRTKFPIPYPVRTTELLYDFVGSATEGEPYGYATPEQAALYAKYNTYTSRSLKYFYSNGYVYILNSEEVANINIRGIFDDPRQLKPFKCAGQPCYTDDDQYDIPADLINSMIRDALTVELRNQFPSQGQVELDKSDKTTEQGGPTKEATN